MHTIQQIPQFAKLFANIEEGARQELMPTLDAENSQAQGIEDGGLAKLLYATW